LPKPAAGTSLATNAYTTNLAAAFALLENTGSALDDSTTNAKDGTVEAGVTWGTDATYGPVVTIGTSATGQVTWTAGTLGALLNGASGVSMTAIVKPSSVAGSKYQNVVAQVAIGSNGAGLWLNICGSDDSTVGNRTKALWGGRAANTDTTFREVIGSTANSADQWVILTGTSVFNGASSTLKVYRNGSPDGTATVSFGGSTYTHGSPSIKDSIGRDSVTADSMSGQVAAVYLHSRALSDAEVAALHSNPWILFTSKQLLIAGNTFLVLE
jgi:hypothetical protein